MDNYFAAGGRLVGYKRFDLIVNAFNRLGWPLKIFGVGPELKFLKRKAKNNIEFLGQISDEAKGRLLSGARAFIHPQVEDFGITAVEAMACGRPVIALSQGGAVETIAPNETGVFFHKQTWESLLDALLHFNDENWDSGKSWTRGQIELFIQNQYQKICGRWKNLKGLIRRLIKHGFFCCG